MSEDEEARVGRAAAFIARRAPGPLTVGVVLGSGLGDFAEQLAGSVRISYADVPGMLEPSVVGHSGSLWAGALAGVSVACLAGRSHSYEGHAPARVVFGVRVLAALGCRIVLLTNAAGGINPRFAASDLMLITDHLNLLGDNPLRGPNYGEGPRFPDMSDAYDVALQRAARAAADSEGIALREGVYAAMLGPSYETPAEIRMLRVLGADAVGMSTVPEVIALRQLGVRVGALSCITNLAAGLAPRRLSHEEVMANAQASRSALQKLLSGWIALAGSTPREA